MPLWLAQELLGSITDTSAYVYLTDGGHFDNMGLYELVRRRCYRIVICDAEEDAEYTYEGIGMAIRKCRIDFGVEIELDLSSLTPNSMSKLSPAHVAYGKIRYPETPKDKLGTIIYIKASLTSKVVPTPGDGGSASGKENPESSKQSAQPGSPNSEPGNRSSALGYGSSTPCSENPVPGEITLPDVPGDVQNYRLQHSTFPHDSTVDQWFTESQFESYRRLGQRVVENMTTLFEDPEGCHKN